MSETGLNSTGGGDLSPFTKRRLEREAREAEEQRAPKAEAISVRKAKEDAARQTAALKERDTGRKSSFEAKRAQEKAEEASKETQRRAAADKAAANRREQEAARQLATMREHAAYAVSPGGKPTLPPKPGGRYGSPTSTGSGGARISPIRKH